MVVPFQKGNLCIECNEFRQKVFVILSYSNYHFFFSNNDTYSCYMVGNDLSVNCCQIHWPQKEERKEFRILNLSLTYFLKFSYYNKQISLICRISILSALAYGGRLYPCNHKKLNTRLVMINCITLCISVCMAVQFHSGFSSNGWVIVVINVYGIPLFSLSYDSYLLSVQDFNLLGR